MSLWTILQNIWELIPTMSLTHVQLHTPTHNHRHISSSISTHTCFFLPVANTMCLFCAASLPPFPPADCRSNMVAPPKDTIYSYWQVTLLVTKGHTVKILNLWRTRTLDVPKYAEKAQKWCCVLCVWLYLPPSSFKQWPKGHNFIGLRWLLPHNVQKSLLFQTSIKASLCMRHYLHDKHVHKHDMCKF